ncbi:cilia- and flagella-associated protein [Chloropicon primus]|uniref:Uncharacterized protein n=1 Tax=Chloropicon primus TaxID=1764295 RepID=A0A5B8MMX7_9CHLO|nr:hypothetical protein A3770_06p43370 [Chloropicon primus]UPR01039.1 cilia- and flagella-associated protein [Chloropicon primus]|eukprot:QDZ21819.1 hypothetical protein A3770_06p43370 [Chloropicon primus]
MLEAYLDLSPTKAVQEPKRPPPPFSLERKEFQTNGPWTFATSPSVVHFDGFQVGKTHTQTIRLVNTADFSQRMHVIKTQNDHFATAMMKKKGLIPPGLSEEIEIEFRPTEWRYYYDCIRIHTEDGNMLIPIHAYPTLNEVNFPRRIDFGRCDLSESRQRKVKLECKVPLDFEFTVEKLGTSPEFEVTPTSGVVSNNKPTEITITFQPMRSTTSTLQLKVNVATANSKPVFCDITGSGFPKNVNEKISKFSSIDPTNLTAEELLTLSAEKKRPKGSKGLTTYGRLNSPGLRGTARKLESREFQTGMKDGGIEFPDLNKLNTHHGVNKVLNQQPDRRVYDKDLNSEQFRTVVPDIDKQLRLFETDLHPLDDWSLSNEVKEKVFQEAWDEKHRTDRVSMMGTKSVGEEEFSQEKVEFFQNALKEQAESQLQCKVERALSNVEGETLAAVSEPYIPIKTNQEIIDEVNPRFDQAINDTWRMRATVIERFIQAARKVIYRNKMDKRLQKLKAFLDKHGRSVAAIAEAVENDNEETGRSTTGEQNLELVYPVLENLEFYKSSTAEDIRFKFNDELEVPRIESYGEVGKYPLKEVFEYKTMGYQEEPFEEFLTYIPPIENEELMEGAIEEYDYDLPTSNLPEIEDVISDRLELPKSPSTQLSLSDKLFMSEYQVRYQEPSLWGLDVDFPIEPRIFTHRVSYLEEETYENTVVSMSNLPVYSKTLSDYYVAQKRVKTLLPDHVPDSMEPGEISFADDPDVEAKEEEREKRLRELPKTMEEIMKKYDLMDDHGNGEDKPEEDESSKAFVHPYEKAMGQLSDFMNEEYRSTTEKTRKCVQAYNSLLKFPSISKVVFGSFPESEGGEGESKESSPAAQE